MITFILNTHCNENKRKKQAENPLKTTSTSSSSSRCAGCHPRVTPLGEGWEAGPWSGGPGGHGRLELTCLRAGLGADF